LKLILYLIAGIKESVKEGPTGIKDAAMKK
jgi:hypothetical protein